MKLLKYYKEEFIKNYKLFKNKKTRMTQIPNILTLSRLLSPIIIVPLVLNNELFLAVLFIVLFAITDLIDGRIARKYKYVSDFGMAVDPICDKVFSTGILIPLIFKNNLLVYNLVGEVIISIISIISKKKGFNTKVSTIGKIKTGFLYVLISYTYLGLFISCSKATFNILYISTLILQLLTSIFYFKAIIKKEKPKDNALRVSILGYKLLRPVIGVLFKIYFRPKVKGLENIPKTGSFILCGNHVNVHDQFPIMINTKRVIHYMAKKEYFDGRMGWFFRFVGQIPVNREIKDTNAKDEAIYILENGGAIGIFPEGTRNKTKEPLLPFKYGAVSIAKKTNTPIVPFAITGNYKFRSKNLNVAIGKPFKVNDNDLTEANDILENKIIELMEKSKHIRKI